MKKTKILTLSVLFACGMTRAYAQSQGPNAVEAVRPLLPALEKVLQLDPVTYKYSKETVTMLHLPAGEQQGFDPVKAKALLPQIVNQRDILVTQGKGTVKAVAFEETDMVKLIPYLVKAIQELQAEVTALKAGQVSGSTNNFGIPSEQLGSEVTNLRNRIH